MTFTVRHGKFPLLSSVSPNKNHLFRLGPWLNHGYVVRHNQRSQNHRLQLQDELRGNNPVEVSQRIYHPCGINGESPENGSEQWKNDERYAKEFSDSANTFWRTKSFKQDPVHPPSTPGCIPGSPSQQYPAVIPAIFRL